MNKIKKYFTITKKSLTDINYYKEIVKTPFWFSLKFLFVLLFVLTLISSIKVASVLALVVPKAPQFVENAKTGARSLFPNGLVITLRNGELSTNAKEPYYIELPSQWGSSKDTHFITINTKVSVDDIQKLNTAVLFTQKSAVIKDQNGSFRVYPFSNIKDTIVLDKDAYNKLMNKVLPYLDLLPKILIILIILAIVIWPFVGATLWLGYELLYLLITTLILLLVAAIMKRKIPYGKLYQMSMHALSLPIIIGFILGFFGLGLPPLVPTAILVIFMGFVISKFK